MLTDMSMTRRGEHDACGAEPRHGGAQEDDPPRPARPVGVATLVAKRADIT
jgi:hypothetical protein